ncbi:MAG: patatin-like phospholipase family protein [Pseudonocardiaceae bacterium]|nr:patatin-like phospholipase family protein [Pseudonocardiaceae bacterium]
MGSRPRLTVAAPRRPRIGVVLGAGGVLGAAWTAGALVTLQQRLDRRIGDADLVVGTSAGSVLATALRCGVDVDDIVEHQRGSAGVALTQLSELDRDSGGALPPLPRLWIGSPQLLLNAARSPLRAHPLVAASALMPQGRAQHPSLARLVDGLLARGAGSWPPAETWIMTVDYGSGRRVAFGRSGAPEATMQDAVVASCSIPGWYEPKTIGDRRYVDGGVRSMASLDLLSRADLDEVYVLAPMASYVADTPINPLACLERRIRRLITIGLTSEARKVRATGAEVTILTPGPEDLAAIGVNLMDPSRRQRVLETSLRTAPGTLDAVEKRRHAA